jgi:NADPH2:quinone reductase
MKKAACLFINPLTALCFMDIVRKAKSDCVIQTAGASAVGKIFTRLCSLENRKIINIVRKY